MSLGGLPCIAPPRTAPREGERYLAVEAHARELPEHVRDAAIDIAIDIADPDARIVAMLARAPMFVAKIWQNRGGRKRKRSRYGCVSRARRGTRTPTVLPTSTSS
jgi:hypothetical protein